MEGDTDMRWRQFVGLSLGLLIAATVYEALVALQAIKLGSEPGAGPPGEAVAGLAAALGILGAVVVTAYLASVFPVRNVLPPLLAPAAAAYLVAYFYSFDPYYLPPLMRYADRDFVSSTFVFALAGLSLGAGLLAWVKPRLGLGLSAPLILLCGLTAWYSGVGH